MNEYALHENSWVAHTMRLVIDTNQASFLPSGQEGSSRLSLSPYVLSEILLRFNPVPTLQLLRTFETRLGLERLDVLLQLSDLSPQEIRAFEPFAVSGQQYRQNYEAMRKALDGPRPEHITWARYIKDSHLRYCGSLVETAKRFRKHLRDCGKGDYKLSRFEDALSEHSSTPESFLGSVIVDSITDGGRRAAKGEPAQLLEGVLSNQYVGRFFRAQLAYYLSISRVWKNQDWNFDPSPTLDDMTDITLPLYAADGDVVVTQDRKLALLVSLIESEGRVRTRKACELA